MPLVHWATPDFANEIAAKSEHTGHSIETRNDDGRVRQSHRCVITECRPSREHRRGPDVEIKRERRPGVDVEIGR
jgi:hypothetical protein